MNVVILHVHERRDIDGVEWWLASPALAPDERVVVWRGIAPSPMPEHVGVAPVVLVGEVEGRTGYAERVPRGVLWSDAALPPALASWVSLRVLAALLALHRSGAFHGSVGSDRVMLGQDGSVVLFGWGRRGATQAADLASVPPPAADPPADASRLLAAWVSEHLPGPGLVDDTVALVVRPDAASDEVVPDLGPDASAGILDRWSVTTATGLTGELTPAAAEHSALSGGDRFEADTWARLERPLPEGPSGRFDGVSVAAARSIRALLADEIPEMLPAASQHHVGVFVGVPVAVDDPTVVGMFAAPEFTATAEPTRTEGAPPRWPRALELAMATAIGAGLAGLVLRAC